MLGLPGVKQLQNQLSGLINSTFSDTTEGLLYKSIGPNWPLLKRGLFSLFAKTNLEQLHKAPELTGSEINQEISQLKSDVIGSSNPLRFIWKTLQAIVGMGKRNRIDSSLTKLKDYTSMRGAPRYVNKTLQQIEYLLHRRISQVESFWSKLGISTTKAVFEDKTFQGLIELFKTWMGQVFSNLINGGFPGQGVSINDTRFLKNFENQIAYGAHAKYLKHDLLPVISQTLNQAQQAIMKVNPNLAKSQGLMEQSPTLTPNPGQHGRTSMPQQLAQTRPQFA